jgi:Na+/H+ antiporter NhaD/arsenite permease-like protein
LLLGRRLREADFSLVFVFAFLFVGIEGLRRGQLYHAIDPERIFGHRPAGLLLSGALLYGVNAGSCGTPIASLANLIGAQIFFKEGGRPRSFWRLFGASSFVLLITLLLYCLALLTSRKAR